MTLLKIFNEQLKQLPTRSEEIEVSILRENWPEQKKKQAIEIVKQLKSQNIVEAFSTGTHDCIYLSWLSITLSPEECGIKDATTFHPGNISQANRYFCNLLEDINKISYPYIHFSIGSHSYEAETTCKYEITWEF